MARWQRQARWVLAVLAIGVAGSVAYTIRPREQVVAPPKHDRVDPKAAIEVHNGAVNTVKGATQDPRLADRGLTTDKDGASALHDAKSTANNRGGRNHTVTGKRAFVSKKNEQIDSYEIRGDVKLETDDGLVATG